MTNAESTLNHGLTLLLELVLTFITKTYLYYFDPLKRHFHIVNSGLQDVHYVFLISAQNIDRGKISFPNCREVKTNNLENICIYLIYFS